MIAIVIVLTKYKTIRIVMAKRGDERTWSADGIKSRGLSFYRHSLSLYRMCAHLTIRRNALPRELLSSIDSQKSFVRSESNKAARIPRKVHGDRYLMARLRFDVTAAMANHPRGRETHAKFTAQKTILKTRKLHWTGA